MFPRRREASATSTEEIIACYDLARRLQQYEPECLLDIALGNFMFKARKELAARGSENLEFIGRISGPEQRPRPVVQAAINAGTEGDAIP
jgi:hypothetical protein